MASKTALVSSDYRVWWVASDCTTVIAGITDEGLLETLKGFEFDVDLTSGYAITVDIEVPLASDTYVQGVDVDLQQSAGFTDTWATAGGMIGIRSDVHVDFVITDAYAGYFNVYVDPAATCTLNDILGVFGRIVLVGPVTAGAATSQVAALRGSISNSSTGSYDGQVYALSLDYGSSVNYTGNTALIYMWTHGDARCDYGIELNNYSPYMVTGLWITETAGDSPAMTTGIAIDATCTTGLSISADSTTGISCAAPVALTDALTITLTGGAHTAVTASVTATTSYSGWALGFFGSTTLSGTFTGANAAGGCFEVNMEALAAPTMSGMVVGAYIGAYSNTAYNKPTAGLWIETIAGTGVSFQADGGAHDMPMIALVTSGAGTKSSLAIEFGSEVAGKTVTTDADGMYYNQTIQMKANGTLIYMPTSSVAGTYTTAYPIVTTFATTAISIGACTTAIGIASDSPIVLGTTVATAATCMTMEFDATTTGVGSFQMGTSGVAQVLVASPGAAVIPFSINILHSAGAGDCDDLIGEYVKVAISGSGDAGTTIVGGAFRAYVGTVLGTTVADEAYGIQPWAKHDGTGAVTAMSAVSALVDVNTDAFTATTVNAGHFHIEGAATVTSSMFDGVMIEVYPDVTCLDAGLRIVADTGAVVAAGIVLQGAITTGIDVIGTVSKGIDFADATLTTGDADNAFIAIGTWNDAYTVPTQTAHFVPLQVNLSSESSYAADVAAARLRVNTGAANTLTAVNVLELRSILAHNVAQHANLQVSTNVTGAVTSTGETFVGYFSLEGTGVLSGGNVSVLKANSHMNGAGCDNVIFGTVYGTGAIVTNVINGYVEPGATATNILSLSNAGGTVTTGISLSGTFGRDLMLSSGAYIMTGSADPNGAVTGVDGSIYLRTGTATANTSFYVCTGTTNWSALGTG